MYKYFTRILKAKFEQEMKTNMIQCSWKMLLQTSTATDKLPNIIYEVSVSQC